MIVPMNHRMHVVTLRAANKPAPELVASYLGRLIAERLKAERQALAAASSSGVLPDAPLPGASLNPGGVSAPPG